MLLFPPQTKDWDLRDGGGILKIMWQDLPTNFLLLISITLAVLDADFITQGRNSSSRGHLLPLMSSFLPLPSPTIF